MTLKHITQRTDVMIKNIYQENRNDKNDKEGKIYHSRSKIDLVLTLVVYIKSLNKIISQIYLTNLSLHFIHLDYTRSAGLLF